MQDDPAINSIVERSQSLWNKGDTAGALEIIRTAYERAPSNVMLAFEYGHILGQLSSGPPSEIKAKRREESIALLGNLCANMDGLDPIEQWKIRRHYFQYSGQHLQNRSLGYEEIKRGNRLGILSVGFGSLHQALDLVTTNHAKEALVYALEAKEAFEKLLAIDEPKYGRFLAYALALALLGQEREALEATGSASKLLGANTKPLLEHNEHMKRLLVVSKQPS